MRTKSCLVTLGFLIAFVFVPVSALAQTATSTAYAELCDTNVLPYTKQALASTYITELTKRGWKIDSNETTCQYNEFNHVSFYKVAIILSTPQIKSFRGYLYGISHLPLGLSVKSRHNIPREDTDLTPDQKISSRLWENLYLDKSTAPVVLDAQSKSENRFTQYKNFLDIVKRAESDSRIKAFVSNGPGKGKVTFSPGYTNRYNVDLVYNRLVKNSDGVDTNLYVSYNIKTKMVDEYRVTESFPTTHFPELAALKSIFKKKGESEKLVGCKIRDYTHTGFISAHLDDDKIWQFDLTLTGSSCGASSLKASIDLKGKILEEHIVQKRS